MSHADAHRALELPLVNGDYAAADDLGHIRAGVYRNYQYARGDKRQGAAGREGIAPVDDHCLNHHGCAAEYLNIHGDDGVEYLVKHAQHRVFRQRSCSHNAGHKTYHETGNRADERDQHGVAHAVKQLRIVFDNYIYNIVKKAHGSLPVFPEHEGSIRAPPQLRFFALSLRYRP